MRTEGTCIHLHRVLHHNTQYLWGLQYSIYARFTHSEICCTDSEREIWNMQISKHEIFAYLTQSQLSLSVISVHNNVFSKDKLFYDLLKYADNYATTSVMMLDVKTVVCESVVVIHKFPHLTSEFPFSSSRQKNVH